MSSGVSVKISAPNGGYVRFSAMPCALAFARDGPGRLTAADRCCTVLAT
jgi:hypothetical protein